MLNQHTALQVKSGSSWHKICPFPVGYIYLSYTNSSPATNYGGSWTAITGRFLYCNKGTGTGGANTHTLTIDQIPSHNHIYIDGGMYCHNTLGSASAPAWGDWNEDGKQTTGFTTENRGGANLITTCPPIKLVMLGVELLNSSDRAWK